MKYFSAAVFFSLLLLNCSKKDSNFITGENSSPGDIKEKPSVVLGENPSSNPEESTSAEVSESPTDPLFQENEIKCEDDDDDYKPHCKDPDKNEDHEK